jgi:hypothetical protein
MRCFTLLVAIAAMTLTGYSTAAEPIETPTPSIEPMAVVTAAPEAVPMPEPTITLVFVPEREIELVAKTLRGECYDDQPDDKREVVKVICNRVSHAKFGDSVEAVVTAPRQFVGYREGNVPTEGDYGIAREVLTEWYEGGCAPLGEYLYFSAGSGRTNKFRTGW